MDKLNNKKYVYNKKKYENAESEGQFNIKTEKEEGICRQTYSDGTIVEGQF